MRALRDYVVLGCTTNIAFLIDVLEHAAFAAGDTHTHFVDAHFPAWHGHRDDRIVAAIVAAIDIARTHRTGPSRPDQLVEASPWGTLGAWRLSHRTQD